MRAWTSAIMLAACCCTILTLPPLSSADFVGVTSVTPADPDTVFLCTEGNGLFIPFPLTVCNVLAVFDNPDNILISVGNADLQVYNGAVPDVFYNHPANFGSPTSYACSAIPGPWNKFPDLICDSYLTIGIKCGPDPPNTDGTTPDDDFDFSEFVNVGHIAGGWFNSAPSNGQGTAGNDPPNENLQVLFLKSSVAQGRSMSGDIDLFWSESDPAGDTIAELDVPVECAAVCPPGEPCDDGNACTEGDVCTNEACIGTPVECHDGDLCTDDSCDPHTGCMYVGIECPEGQFCDEETGTCGCPPGEPCDDGDACTEGDVCTNEACSGTPVDCHDGNLCTNDSCDSDTGCIHVGLECPEGQVCDEMTGTCGCPPGVPCDDGDVCTEGDVCTNEGCLGTPVDCHDGNPCTDDSCEPDTGCVHVGIQCPEGQVCDELTGACRDAELGDQLFKLLPDDGAADDEFGISVVISGTTAIAGAWHDDVNGTDSGSAYLFDATTGQQTAKLLPNDGEANDQFGLSVAISGTTAIVGANQDNDNGTWSGSAYLFDTTTGQQVAKLLPDDGSCYKRFGASVAISETTAIVGSKGNDNGVDSGAAYLFDTTTGQQIAKLLPDDGDEWDRFGRTVAISGTTAIVGAALDDDNGLNSGSAYLFDITTGQQIAKLLPGDGAEQDRFGVSVAISGTTAIVGAWWDDDNGPYSGSAYLFNTATGQEIAKLLPPDGAPFDGFGVSVAISETTAIVGSSGDDDACPSPPYCYSGSAYFFDTTTGQQIVKLLANDGAAGDVFGWSVAISGATAVVGAFGNEDNGEDSGAAYLFDAAGDSDCPEDSDGRVTLCHIPPGNPDNAHTITVSVNAVPAHLAHGDYCGPCAEDEDLLVQSGGDTGHDLCPSDLDDTGVVGTADLAQLIGAWGSNPGHPADLDGDSDVDAADLAVLLGNWGACL